MATAPRLIDPRDPPGSPTPGENGHWRGAVRSYHGQPAADHCRRRFNRVTLGFWLGGLVLGTGGCILGACQPYRHAVAVTISVLWWGIYFGCFGASIGALVGLWTDRTDEPSSNEPMQPPNAEPSLILEDETLSRKPSVLAHNRRAGKRGPG